MIQKKTKRRASAVLLGAAMTVPLTASGAGFHLIEQGNRGLGNAYAGAAAVADDATTIYFNPAGMTRLDQREFNGGLAVIDLRGDFTKESATDAAGQPLSGGEGGNIGDGATPIPNIYYHHPINDTTHFGLGIGAPFGLATDYDRDSIFRYQARRSEVAIININPSMAWKLDDTWSIGAGLNVQFMDVELSNAIDFGAVCFDQADPTTCAAIGLTPQSADGHARISGDSVGYGFNVGVLGEWDQTRIGVHYRSQVQHDLSGNARFDVPEGVPAAFATAFSDSRVDAGFRAPDSLSFSVAHELDDRWTLLGDITWMGWSTFDELRVEYRNPETLGGEDTVEEQNYSDDMRYSVGFDYRHNDQWTLRAGLAYDESPVSTEYRTARLPDDDRTWLSLGATYRPSANHELDFAYTHLFLDDRIPLDHTGNQGDRIIGTYEVSANIVGFSWRYLFD